MNPRTQKFVSFGIGAIGLGLLVMMVVVEGEPGAIPLALLLVSAALYVGAVLRERSSRRK